MNPEKVEIAKEDRRALVDKIISTPVRFEAFLAHDQLIRARVSHLEAIATLHNEQMFIGGSQKEDNQRLNQAIVDEKETKERKDKLMDLIGQQKIADPVFKQAYYETRRDLEIVGFSHILDSVDTQSVVRILDEIGQDYRIPLFKLVREIKKDSTKETAFKFYGEMVKLEMKHNYENSGIFSRRADIGPLREQLEAAKNANPNFGPTFVSVRSTIGEATRLSGVQGPFGEQFIIESIENVLDPTLKKERDRKAGRIVIKQDKR